MTENKTSISGMGTQLFRVKPNSMTVIGSLSYTIYGEHDKVVANGDYPFWTTLGCTEDWVSAYQQYRAYILESVVLRCPTARTIQITSCTIQPWIADR